MFFPASAIESNFRCEFCRSELSSGVKVLPECGSIICDGCYANLPTGPNEFKCAVCKELHVIPKAGLANVRALMNVLQLQPEEKPLSEDAKTLRELLKDAHHRIRRLESFNRKEAIDAHCEELMIEVIETVDSAVKHVNRLGDDLVRQIVEYRNHLLAADSEETEQLPNEQNEKLVNAQATVKLQLAEISKEVKRMSEEWTPYFTQMNALAKEARIQSARQRAEKCHAVLSQLEALMRQNALENRFLRFKPDENFLNASVGKLVIENSATGNQAKSSLLATFSQPGEIHELLFLEGGNLATASRDSVIRIYSTTGQLVSDLRGHSDWILCMELLPNGWLASGSRDRSVRMWDLKARRPAGILLGHKKSVFSLKALVNGNLASCSFDNTIKIWNPFSRSLLLTIEGHCVSNFSSSVNMGLLSDRNLVTCSNETDRDNTIRVWNPTDGSLVKTLTTGSRLAESLLVLASDKIAVGFRGLIKIFKIFDLARQIEPMVLASEDSSCLLLQLTNRYLLCASYSSAIKIWNPENGRLVQEITTRNQSRISCLAASPDEKLIAIGSIDKTITIFSLIYE